MKSLNHHMHRHQRVVSGFSPSSAVSQREASPTQKTMSCGLKPGDTLLIAALICAIGLVRAQEKPSADTINGVKGVKQEAVQSLKKIAPPTVVPVTPPPPTGVTQPVSPPPPSPTATPVNQVNGVKAVPPPPAAAISTIRTVQGVQGIIAPKQLNLEAALLIKEDAKGTPAGGGAEGGKGKAAAAALLNGPKGLIPAAPIPNGDGRAGFQEFEKLDKPGS